MLSPNQVKFSISFYTTNKSPSNYGRPNQSKYNLENTKKWQKINAESTVFHELFMWICRLWSGCLLWLFLYKKCNIYRCHVHNIWHSKKISFNAIIFCRTFMSVNNLQHYIFLDILQREVSICSWILWYVWSQNPLSLGNSK